MIYDRATRLLPTERATALVLAIAALADPCRLTRALAADLLATLVFATRAEDAYLIAGEAVQFAMESTKP